MTTAISLAKVSKRFGTVQALEGINLQVCEGEFVSLIGPSGCGKTTLLKLAAGLETATEGEVTLFGEPPHQLCRKHQVGVAFQKPAIASFRTARKNVELTLEVLRVSPPERKKLAAEILCDFGLAGFLDHHPEQLSGGMQQRVNIAGALVHNPSVLLLDEPFGALDSITRANMYTWLSNVLSQTVKTVLFVTHDVREAVFLSNRVLILSPRPGKIYSEFEINFSRRDKKLRHEIEFLETVAKIEECLEIVVNGNGGAE